MSLSAAEKRELKKNLSYRVDFTDFSSFHDRRFFFDDAFLLHCLFVGLVQFGQRLLQIADLLLCTVQFVRGAFCFGL